MMAKLTMKWIFLKLAWGECRTKIATLSNDIILAVKEDLSQFKMRKMRSAQSDFPTYEHVNDLEGQGISSEVFNVKQF